MADAGIPRTIPAGLPANKLNLSNSPLALDPNSFTALGPRPLRTTGCSGCFDYGTAEGRVNDVVIDPVATNVAYLASVGGGVWKTTTCCSASTSWSAVTDDPLQKFYETNRVQSLKPHLGTEPRVFYAGIDKEVR